MSILSIFDTGKTALMASQTAISVTSHNISNANNPDYSRQEVILNVKTPIKIRGGYLGRGVYIDNIKRSYNKFLTDMLFNQESLLSRSSVLKDIISHVEEVFNEANRDGLIANFNEFFNSLEDLMANPADISKRIVLLNNSSGLVDHFKQTEVDLDSIVNNIDKEMKNLVTRINAIAKEIAEINIKINQLEAGVLFQANDLRDKRDALLKELSQYLNINYHESQDRIFYVTIGMRNIVAGGTAFDVNLLKTSQGSVVKVDNVDITDRIISGKINGLITAQNFINNEVIYNIRKLFANFTNQFNLIHLNGIDLDNNMGQSFFSIVNTVHYENFSNLANVTSANISNYNNVKFDEYLININTGNTFEVINRQNKRVIASGTYVSGDTISFDGIDVVISGTVSQGDKFFISPIKSAIENGGVVLNDPRKIALALSTDSPSDNRNLLSLINLKESNLNSLENKNIYNYLEDLISKIGVLSNSANANLRFDQVLYNEISNRKNVVQGVNLDEEAVNLIKYQRAFEASAKVIQVANELYETLVKLL